MPASSLASRQIKYADFSSYSPFKQDESINTLQNFL